MCYCNVVFSCDQPTVECKHLVKQKYMFSISYGLQYDVGVT